MSNITQFNGTGFSIGSTMLFPVATYWPYGANKFQASDGTVWLPNHANTLIPYDSSYGNLPPNITITSTVINGPVNGGFCTIDTNIPYSLAYDAANTTFCTTAIDTNGTNTFYYTSNDNGATWTKRTFPYNIQYNYINYINGKFIAISSTTTNGCLTSTDAINWTAASINTISSSVYALCGNGSSNVVAITGGGTLLYSSNNGLSWSSSSGASSLATAQKNTGSITWNQNAGLFILSKQYGYFTSPDGVTWTDRSTTCGLQKYIYFNSTSGILFASNNSTTVIFMNNGLVGTSTDGLTWSNVKYISTNLVGYSPTAAWYDGSYFNIVYGVRRFYSSNGIDWYESLPLSQLYSGNSFYCAIVTCGNKIICFQTNYSTTYPMMCLEIQNPTNTTPTFITYSGLYTTGNANSIVRIK